MGCALSTSTRPVHSNATIVAIRVKKPSPIAVVTAGHQEKPPVNGEAFLLEFLREQEEKEIQAIVSSLFPEERKSGEQ